MLTPLWRLKSVFSLTLFLSLHRCDEAVFCTWTPQSSNCSSDSTAPLFLCVMDWIMMTKCLLCRCGRIVLLVLPNGWMLCDMMSCRSVLNMFTHPEVYISVHKKLSIHGLILKLQMFACSEEHFLQEEWSDFLHRSFSATVGTILTHTRLKTCIHSCAGLLLHTLETAACYTPVGNKSPSCPSCLSVSCVSASLPRTSPLIPAQTRPPRWSASVWRIKGMRGLEMSPGASEATWIAFREAAAVHKWLLSWF